MDMDSAWKKTCTVIFGQEIGELGQFAPYLREYLYSPLVRGKSSVSGKDVWVGTDRYCKGAKLLSQDEIGAGKPEFAGVPAELSINDIKDIDSLLESISGSFCYSGNKLFGTCSNIENVDNCSDSHFVENSYTVVSSKYVGYSAFIRNNSEFVFGSSTLINGSHLIRILGTDSLSRSFECSWTTKSSDMFFTSNCRDCSECMFSFNLRSKKYRIGNMELEKHKYLGLKKKLTAEVAQWLERKKNFPSVFSITSKPPEKLVAGLRARGVGAGISSSGKPHAKPAWDRAGVETAFTEATRLILGQGLENIDDYSAFLSERTDKIYKIRTPFGSEAFHSHYFRGGRVPEARMVSLEEAVELGKADIGQGCDFTLSGIMGRLGDIAFYSVGLAEGNNRNNSEVPVQYHATDSYKVSDSTFSKKCAYCTHTQNCDSVFGSSVLMVESSFCLRCHDCVKLNACIDMDSSKNCYRCMFCHNCEGLSDCMFCFNAKNLKYAIGNVEVGREKYEKIRSRVVRELLDRLEKTGTFGFDICNLGCFKPGKK
ncbi:MAG: hypothetical protein WC506_02260 [Candidatus Micrarchaeia archaeon]